eukprot:gene457-830_t
MSFDGLTGLDDSIIISPRIKKKSALKAAAEQYALEESQMSTSAFLEAAADVAMEQGLQIGNHSPTPSATEFENASEAVNSRKKSADEVANALINEMGIDPSKLTAPKSINDLTFEAAEALLLSNNINPDIDMDTTAMLQAMGITPSNHDDDNLEALANDMGITLPKSDLDADTQALFANMGLDINGIDADANALIQNLKGSREVERYLLQYGRKNSQSSKFNHRYFNERVISEPSDISKLLRRSQNKPWEKQITKSFSNFTEERLFRNMRIARPSTSSTSSSKKLSMSQEFILEQSHRLANTKKKNNTLSTEKALRILQIYSRGNTVAERKIYAKDDDKLNCTFKPQCVTAQSVEITNDDDDNAKSNFIERQEAFQKELRFSIEKARGKADYDVRLDKKICPICTSKQSYDEVKEKRKKCPNCAVDYQHKINWSAIRKKFYQRQEEYIQKFHEFENFVHESKQFEVEEYRNTIKRAVYDYKTHKMEIKEMETEFPVWTPDVEEDFFNRMMEKLDIKKKKLQELTNTIYNPEVYPFQPNTSTSRSMGSTSSRNRSTLYGDEFDEDYDPVKEFERRYTVDLMRRQSRDGLFDDQSGSGSESMSSARSSHKNARRSTSTSTNSNSNRRRSNSTDYRSTEHRIIIEFDNVQLQFCKRVTKCKIISFIYAKVQQHCTNTFKTIAMNIIVFRLHNTTTCVVIKHIEPSITNIFTNISEGYF